MNKLYSFRLQFENLNHKVNGMHTNLSTMVEHLKYRGYELIMSEQRIDSLPLTLIVYHPVIEEQQLLREVSEIATRNRLPYQKDILYKYVL